MATTGQKRAARIESSTSRRWSSSTAAMAGVVATPGALRLTRGLPWNSTPRSTPTLKLGLNTVPL